MNLHPNKPPAWLVHIPGHPWVLGQTMGTLDHKTHHGPDSGEAATFPHIVFSAPRFGRRSAALSPFSGHVSERSPISLSECYFLQQFLERFLFLMMDLCSEAADHQSSRFDEFVLVSRKIRKARRGAHASSPTVRKNSPTANVTRSQVTGVKPK
jgi:hypothetical protein